MDSQIGLWLGVGRAGFVPMPSCFFLFQGACDHWSSSCDTSGEWVNISCWKEELVKHRDVSFLRSYVLWDFDGKKDRRWAIDRGVLHSAKGETQGMSFSSESHGFCLSTSQIWGWGNLSLTPEQLEWFALLRVFSFRTTVLSIAHRIQPLVSWQIPEHKLHELVA